MNGILLAEKIEVNKLSKSYVAGALGLTRQGFYNKINGKREFKSSEIKKLSSMLNLSETEKNAIFFTDCVD